MAAGHDLGNKKNHDISKTIGLMSAKLSPMAYKKNLNLKIQGPVDLVITLFFRVR